MDKMRELELSDVHDFWGALLGELSLTSSQRRKITALAAGAGRLTCLRVLRARQYPLSQFAWEKAAAGGHLHVLRYLHEESEVQGGKYVTSYAAGNGHLHCLKFLHSINANWGTYTADAAAAGGRLECLAYLIQNGCPFTPLACSYAAQKGHIESLRLLQLHSCPWDENTTRTAVKFGHFSCLQYAVESGCPVEDDTFVAALEMGNLQCLEYLLRAGHRPKLPLKLCSLPGDSQVGCLKLAASFGVRFSTGQLILAASLGKLEHVRFLHSSGHSLWQNALDRFEDPPSDWTGWRSFLKGKDAIWDHGVLHLPPTDAHLRACWGTLRFGSLHGALLTPRAEALVRERRACAQEVVRCFHAARWRAQGGGPAASMWGAMSQVPAEVLIMIMELAEVEIYEALR